MIQTNEDIDNLGIVLENQPLTPAIWYVTETTTLCFSIISSKIWSFDQSP